MSGGMLLATAWRSQTREEARSLTSAADVEVGMAAQESLRNACWRDLEVGSGRLAFAQTATKFMEGVAMTWGRRWEMKRSAEWVQTRSTGSTLTSRGARAEICRKKAGVLLVKSQTTRAIL